jgi:hypothetical protein
VKELGKKYSSLFGVEKTVSREAIAAIHRLVGEGMCDDDWVD